MPELSSTTEVQVSRRFHASAQAVFDGWTIPATARHWLFATPTGRLTRVDIDARPGGRFMVVDLRDGQEVAHTGEYITVEPPHRLVFDFAVPRFSQKVSRIRIDIADAGQGGSALTLVHEGVLLPYAARTQQGWATMLAALDEAVRS